MTEKTGKSEGPRRTMQPALPKRPSYEKALEDIEKWANSAGLQKPN